MYPKTTKSIQSLNTREIQNESYRIDHIELKTKKRTILSSAKRVTNQTRHIEETNLKSRSRKNQSREEEIKETQQYSFDTMQDFLDALKDDRNPYKH